MRRFSAVNRPDIDSRQPTGTQEHGRPAKVTALGEPAVIRNYLYLGASQRSYTVDAEVDARTSAPTARNDASAFHLRQRRSCARVDALKGRSSGLRGGIGTLSVLDA